VARSTRAGRAVVIGACTLAILALFGAVVRQSYVVNRDAAEIVRLEAQGAAVLHTMTSLLAELVAAQSAAVRGEPLDADGLRKALADAKDEGAPYGASLQTTQRLEDLRVQTESLLSRSETGRAAYNSYSVVVRLAVDLIRRIGDTSHLVHDPDLDSYYLMDAAIIRLPSAMVLAGQAADLVALAGGKALTGEDAIKAAVARFGVSTAAEEVSAGLSKSIDFTSRSALGTNITDRLDAFKAAADAFAPPTILFGLSGAIEAGALAADARRVAAAADPLAHRLLGELEVLLQTRASRLDGQWRFTAIAGGVATAFALLVLWLIVFPRPRAGGVTVAPDGPPRTPRPGEVQLGSLAYAREILDGDRVVHVGRAARPPSRESGDAAG
jgi:hypothetical protein